MGVYLQMETMDSEIKRLKRRASALKGLTSLAFKVAQSKSLTNMPQKPEAHHIIEGLTELVSTNVMAKVQKELEFHNATKEDLVNLKC